MFVEKWKVHRTLSSVKFSALSVYASHTVIRVSLSGFLNEISIVLFHLKRRCDFINPSLILRIQRFVSLSFFYFFFFYSTMHDIRLALDYHSVFLFVLCVEFKLGGHVLRLRIDGEEWSPLFKITKVWLCSSRNYPRACFKHFIEYFSSMVRCHVLLSASSRNCEQFSRLR